MAVLPCGMAPPTCCDRIYRPGCTAARDRQSRLLVGAWTEGAAAAGSNASSRPQRVGSSSHAADSLDFCGPFLIRRRIWLAQLPATSIISESTVLSAVVTGVIWAAWHVPVLVRGYAFPDNPYSGLPVFLGSAVLLSIIFGWLRLKTGSIWSTSLAHAATNVVGGQMTFLLFSGGASHAPCLRPGNARLDTARRAQRVDRVHRAIEAGSSSE